LPATVAVFGPDDFYEGSGGIIGLYYNPSNFGYSDDGSMGESVLYDAENVNVYFTGPIVPDINSADVIPLPQDENSHILAIYNYISRYRMKTNWCTIENLIGFADEGTFKVGDVLPTYDDDGYELE